MYTVVNSRAYDAANLNPGMPTPIWRTGYDRGRRAAGCILALVAAGSSLLAKKAMLRRKKAAVNGVICAEAVQLP